MAKNKPLKAKNVAQRPGGYAKQAGSSLAVYSAVSVDGFLSHPDGSKLIEFERAATTDETVKAALDLIRLSLIASIGPYEHANHDVQNFVQDNLDHMLTPWKTMLGSAAYSSLWSGFSLGEILWRVKDGQLWLDDVALYNPLSIFFVVDKNGRLTEGDRDILKDQARKVPGNLRKTGIYQQRYDIGANTVRIPMNKTYLVSHDKQYGNYYGQSALKAVYQDWKYKVAAEEMLLVALDRYGTPVVYAVVPLGVTNDVIADPQSPTGFRNVTIGEATEKALGEISTGTGLVLQNPSPDEKVQIGTLTTGNNFGSSFQDAISMWNRSIFRGMLLPSLLLEDQQGAFSGGGQSQVHFEVFKQVLEGIYEEVVTPFVQQVIGRLVKLNFGIDDPGRIPMEPFDPSARDTISQVLERYVNLGVVDPSDIEDLNTLRRFAGVTARKDNKTFLPKSPALIEQKLKEAQTKQYISQADATGREIEPSEHTVGLDKEELALRREELEFKKKDATQKQKLDAQKLQLDHEHRMTAASQQHEQQLAMIKKGLTAPPAATSNPSTPAAKSTPAKPAGTASAPNPKEKA